MKLLICALILTAGATWAKDAKLDGAAITALTDHSLTYDDGSKQVFKAGGETVYDNGKPSAGRWQVRGDQYCSVWPPSDVWACYDVTQSAAGIGFVAGDGSASLGHLAP